MIKIDYKITELPKLVNPNFKDERGFLVEFLKNSELCLEHKPFGQIYLATIRKGHVRGNHYHAEKREHFTIMGGKVRILLEDIHTKERKELLIDPSKKTITKVEFGTNVAHAIESIGKEDAIVVAYSTTEYNPNIMDDVPYKLI